VGAEIPVTSRDLQVFVDESAEAVASEVSNLRTIWVVVRVVPLGH